MSAKPETAKAYSRDAFMTAADSPDNNLDAFKLFIRHPNIACFGSSAIVMLSWHLLIGAWSWVDLVIAIFIILAWPFMEWKLHIAVLHMKPRKLFGRDFYPDAAAKHRAHHMEPWRLELVFLRPYVLFSIPIVFIMANVLLPLPQALTVCFVGYFMAVQYEWTHFVTHTRVKPRSQWFKKVFNNHRMHHFRNEHYWYAFAVPWVDEYYKTGPKAETVEPSDSCKDLGLKL